MVRWSLLTSLLLYAWLVGACQTSVTPISTDVLQDPHTASYQITARLDPVAKTLHGTAHITYRNTSSDMLSEVWFRLYLQAFQDRNTFWMREYADAATLTDEHRGAITLEQLSLSDGTDLLPTTTMTDTLLQVPLPTALAPDQTVTFDVAWVTTLPRVFYLTGYGGRDDTFFMLGQWYPHLAVYHDGIWDTEPWHAETSFFHDFAQYAVELTVPEDYLVASTGVPAGETTTEAGLRTTRYTADRVTNFAFAASPDFQLATTQVGDTEILLYHMPDRAAYVTEYLDVARESMTAYNDWYEPYPHSRLTIVDVPDGADAAASMEYPMLFTVHPRGAPPDSGGVAFIVSHEMAHQWWPMQVSTNEAREPWLDEGVVTYSGIRYLAEAQRTVVGDEVIPYSQSWYNDIPKAATLPMWDYTHTESRAAVYHKTALGLWTLEHLVGTEPFHQALAQYVTRYRFGIASGSDFRDTLTEAFDTDVTWFFDFIDGEGRINYAIGAIETNEQETTIQIERVEEIAVPVEVEITFASGATERTTWDGQATETMLVFPADDPVVAVQIDPEQKLLVELQRFDNTRSLEE